MSKENKLVQKKLASVIRKTESLLYERSLEEVGLFAKHSIAKAKRGMCLPVNISRDKYQAGRMLQLETS